MKYSHQQAGLGLMMWYRFEPQGGEGMTRVRTGEVVSAQRPANARVLPQAYPHRLGKAQYALCATSRGAGAEGNGALGAPRLSGQYDWYSVRQKKSYTSSRRGAHSADSVGQTMEGMAMVLPDDDAIDDATAYMQNFSK